MCLFVFCREVELVLFSQVVSMWLNFRPHISHSTHLAYIFIVYRLTSLQVCLTVYEVKQLTHYSIKRCAAYGALSRTIFIDSSIDLESSVSLLICFLQQLCVGSVASLGFGAAPPLKICRKSECKWIPAPVLPNYLAENCTKSQDPWLAGITESQMKWQNYQRAWQEIGKWEICLVKVFNYSDPFSWARPRFWNMVISVFLTASHAKNRGYTNHGLLLHRNEWNTLQFMAALLKTFSPLSARSPGAMLRCLSVKMT